MRTVLIFTITYTVALFVYGQIVESPLANRYTGINIGLFILFAVLHRWAEWPVHSLWAMSLVGWATCWVASCWSMEFLSTPRI